MAYATRQDMIDRFGERELIELTDRAAATAIVDAVLDRGLADAAATIDAYIAARYALPLPSVPAVLTATACDIARYRLQEDSPSEVAKDRHAQAIRFLMALSKGDAKLDIDGAEPAAAAGSVGIESAARVFSRDRLRDF